MNKILLAIGVAVTLLSVYFDSRGGGTQDSTLQPQYILGQTISSKRLIRCGLSCYYIGNYRVNLDSIEVGDELPWNLGFVNSGISPHDLVAQPPRGNEDRRTMKSLPLTNGAMPDLHVVESISRRDGIVTFTNGQRLSVPSFDRLLDFEPGSYWVIYTEPREPHKITQRSQRINLGQASY
jgi:hypothetical protein